MPKIAKIKIEGFVSVIEKVKYKFDRPGISLILGKNGAGKTTIFNALSFGLYGQTLKPKSSILPWPNIIDENYRGCKVDIELDDGIRIIRCNEYKGKVLGRAGKNRLIILRNDAELLSLRGKVDAQSWINTHLGYTFQLFKTSILFAQELTSLIEDDGPTKKRTFDEAFASAFINRAKEMAENRLSILTEEYDTTKSDLAAKSEILESNRNLLGSLQEAAKNYAIEKGRKINLLRKEVRVLKNENTVLKEKYNPYTKKRELKQLRKELHNQRDILIDGINNNLVGEEFQLMLDITRYETELEEIKAKQVKTKANMKPICSVCGMNLKGDKLTKYRQEIKQQFTALKKKERELDDLLKLTRKRHSRARDKIESQAADVINLADIKNQIKVKESEIEALDIITRKMSKRKVQARQIKREISRVRKDKKNFNTTEIEANITKYESLHAELTEKAEDVKKKKDLQIWLIKDPLSNSGLKAFIFDSMLKRVNYFLLHYTTYIGFQVKVAMDLESSNKDFLISILKNGDEVPYQDLSKGQKQLTKVVLCFALNDTIDASKPLNIMLMDELFESLDPQNIEIVANIITKKAQTKSIHLITHSESFNPSNCYRTYVKLNAKNQTVIEQKWRDA